MAESTQRIIQNTAYLTMALVIQKVIAFFFFLYIARTLGGEGTGQYVAAFALSSLFSVGVDIGLAPVLVREVARNPDTSERYLRNALSMKLIAAVLAFGALMLTIAIIDWLGGHHPPAGIVAVAGVIMVLDSFTLTGTSLFRGWQLLGYEAFVVVAQKIGILAIGSVVLLLWPSPVNLAFGILVGSFVAYGLLFRFLSERIVAFWRPAWDRDVVRTLLRQALPFAIASFFFSAYAQLDSVILSALQGSHAVGLYSIAAKTMNAFAFIPMAFGAALYPALSAYAIASPAQLAATAERSLRYLLIVAAPIAVGFYLIADRFVALLGPDYTEAAVAVRIVVPSLVFVFLSFPLGALLNATNHQHWQTAIMGAGLVTNLALNIYWIPRYSFYGASAAWFFSNGLMCVLGFMLARRVVAYGLARFVLAGVRVAAAAAIMGAVVSMLLPSLSLPIVIVIGGIIYILSVWGLREVSFDDVQFVVSVFRRRPAPPEQVASHLE